MRKGYDELPDEVKKEIERLAEMSDDDIDYTDIPPTTDFSGAQRGVFYRPMKRQITLRLDSDIVAWFKLKSPGGRGYQTRINEALREHIRQQGDKKKSV